MILHPPMRTRPSVGCGVRLRLLAAAAGGLWFAGCAGLHGPARSVEGTPHFAVRSQLPARYDQRLRRRVEAAYAEVARLLGPLRDDAWPGRCEVVCLRSRERFERAIAERGQAQPHSDNHAYLFDTGAQLVLVVHNPAWVRHGQVFPAVAHEVTHAYLSRYRSTAPLPAWLEEGLAQHFEFQQPEAAASARRQRALACAGSPRARARERALLRVMGADAIAEADESGYAQAWRLVEFLLHHDRDRFRQLVRGLKAGADTDDALRAAYGWGREALASKAAEWDWPP